MTQTPTERAYFDLNVEQVLEHWGVAEAVRELLANALDEHLLGHGQPPQIDVDSAGRVHIRDFGRGIGPEHFTQNENPEKLTSDLVIGRFGVGLKDALAVFHRHGISVCAHTATADVTIDMHSKAGFAIDTLHAVFSPPTRAGFAGTEFVLDGVEPSHLDEAKRFFRYWTPSDVLDHTPYGDILDRAGDEPAAVFVRGIRVAEEPDFLFSYDITKLTTKLTRALNRERANVSRTAYGDRVKDLLLASTAGQVMDRLAGDLEAFESGEQHAESTWVDVSLHAACVLNASDDVVFVTAAQLAKGGPMFDYARADGKRLITVPDKLASKLARAVDVNGNLIRTLARYAEEWANSFEFAFVDPADLTAAEADVFARTDQLLHLVGFVAGDWKVLITETMRPGHDDELGLCRFAARQIVIRRDQLADLSRYAGTLLHEAVHAITHANDATLLFESGLTDVIGGLAAPLVERDLS
jgi:hypothetical protein